MLCEIEICKELFDKPRYAAPTFKMNPDIKDFYKFTVDDFLLEDYKYSPLNKKIEVAV